MSATAEETHERWQRPAVKVPAAHYQMLGRQVAEQTITALADAGMSPSRIATVQEHIAIHVLNEATTREGQLFAAEYDNTARTLVRELQEMEAGQ